MHHKRRWMVGIAVSAVAALSLGACSAGQQDEAPDGEVTIHVGNMPTKDNAEALAAFEDQVDAFEELHPDVTVVGEETKYDPSTFSALVAGGSMPTMMLVPYTNIQQLARNGQVRDITEAVEGDEVLSELNPDVAKQTQDADGRTFGIVAAAYTMGLVYNRALYESAGLNPDQPPSTWDEVRNNAKAITAATGVAGYSMATTNNSGGWILTGLSYGHGSQVQETAGETVTANVDSDGVAGALQFLHDVRWTDGSAGDNFLMSQDDIRNAVAAGQVGQTVLGADVYRDLVGNRGMPGDDLGIAPMPQSETGIGTLGGGDIAVLSPNATPEEADAALEWVKFHYLNKYLDEKAAIRWAESSKAAGLPVGAPEVPLFSEEVYDRYLSWIADYVNVDRDHFTTYFDSLGTLPIVGEPPVAAQETYSLLDAIVQQVLTSQETDVDAALEQAQQEAQSLIDASF